MLLNQVRALIGGSLWFLPQDLNKLPQLCSCALLRSPSLKLWSNRLRSCGHMASPLVIPLPVPLLPGFQEDPTQSWIPFWQGVTLVKETPPTTRNLNRVWTGVLQGVPKQANYDIVGKFQWSDRSVMNIKLDNYLQKFRDLQTQATKMDKTTRIGFLITSFPMNVN